MKKLMVLVFVGLFVIGMPTSVLAADISDYNKDLELKSFQGSVIISLNSDRAFVDGKEVLGGKAILENGLTLVPLRFVGENLKAKVVWQPVGQKVQVTLGDKVVSLNIGSKEMFLGSKKISLDVPAMLIKGTTYLPLRAIGDALGKYVDYKNDYKFICISDKAVDLNYKSLLNTLKVAFDESYKVIYGDNWVIFAEKNNRLCVWDLNNQDNFMDTSYSFSGSWLKEGKALYYSIRIGDGIMGSDLIFAIYPDKKVKYIYSTDLLDMKEKDGYLYMMVENDSRASINDCFETMQKFSGNLIRVNINKAIKYQETAKNNEPFQAEPLGVKGYFYGIYPIVEKYYNTDKMVVRGFKSNMIDWEIKADGVYAVGVDFTSDKADKTIAKYKIPFTGRSHEKIGEITTH